MCVSVCLSVCVQDCVSIYFCDVCHYDMALDNLLPFLKVERMGNQGYLNELNFIL